jgi:hypothetical protein
VSKAEIFCIKQDKVWRDADRSEDIGNRCSVADLTAKFIQRGLGRAEPLQRRKVRTIRRRVGGLKLLLKCRNRTLAPVAPENPRGLQWNG